ncbi:hypothetical protein DEO72_LG9g997 [Vigna unguiculata]|uniref:Uncharacterized protein n=1 Tax=Vigna unguiculata TaxID=3917 RepID=A0A4D6MY63_VIGUN|nr:hypothetical protein DEO72_LG9g997 [Vigna unguiculata]
MPPHAGQNPRRQRRPPRANHREPTTVKELSTFGPLSSFILLRPPPTTSAGGSTSLFSRTTEPVGYCVFRSSDDQPTSLPPYRPPQLGHASTMETQPLAFATQIATAAPQRVTKDGMVLVGFDEGE